MIFEEFSKILKETNNKILDLTVATFICLEVNPSCFISESGERNVAPLQPNFKVHHPLAFLTEPGESCQASTGALLLASKQTLPVPVPAAGKGWEGEKGLPPRCPASGLGVNSCLFSRERAPSQPEEKRYPWLWPRL